jgi:hypothetical protein
MDMNCLPNIFLNKQNEFRSVRTPTDRKNSEQFQRTANRDVRACPRGRPETENSFSEQGCRGVPSRPPGSSKQFQRTANRDVGACPRGRPEAVNSFSEQGCRGVPFLRVRDCSGYPAAQRGVGAESPTSKSRASANARGRVLLGTPKSQCGVRRVRAGFGLRLF